MPTQNTQAANPRLAVKNPVDPALAGLLNAAASATGGANSGSASGSSGPTPTPFEPLPTTSGPTPSPFEPLPTQLEGRSTVPNTGSLPTSPFDAGGAYESQNAYAYGNGSGSWSPFRSSTLDSMGGGGRSQGSTASSFTPPPAVDPYEALFKKQEYERRIAEMAQQALSAQEESAMSPLRQRQLQANINATDMNTNATNANIQNQSDELELNRRRYNSGGPLAGLWRQQYNTR